MDTHSASFASHGAPVSDPRDDPASMNWAETLFNPVGETSKLHFTRAWTLMFLGRLGLYLIPSFAAGVMAMSGMDMAGINTPVDLFLLSVPLILIPFALFTFVTEFTSYVAHVRRLADARRPAWLAVIVLVPMILALVAYVAGAGMGAAKHKEINAPAAETTVAADAPAGAKADAKAEPKSEAKPKRGGGERRGPPGPPQTARQMAISTGLGMALPIWALASFGVMWWTLAYVARLPNGGQGSLRLGRDPDPDDGFAAV